MVILWFMTLSVKVHSTCNVGVGVCSKHFYSYLFSSRWAIMKKKAVG